MKYLIYKDVPLVSGDRHRCYLNDAGNYTTTPDSAMKINVRTVLQLLIIVLQLILKHKQTFKYERYEK